MVFVNTVVLVQGQFKLTEQDTALTLAAFGVGSMLVAQLDPVPHGEYQVDWRGLSEDGHPMKGTFSFTVK